MSRLRAHLRREAREARRRMIVPAPIAPIDDHFAKASVTHQGATGCLTVGAFARSLRSVRRERRGA